jgi:hypothetical protein
LNAATAAGVQGQDTAPTAPHPSRDTHSTQRSPCIGIGTAVHAATTNTSTWSVSADTHLSPGTARWWVKRPCGDDAGLTQRLGNIRPDHVAPHDCDRGSSAQHSTAQHSLVEARVTSLEQRLCHAENQKSKPHSPHAVLLGFEVDSCGQGLQKAMPTWPPLLYHPTGHREHVLMSALLP